MAELGFRTFNEMIGRVDCLRDRTTRSATGRPTGIDLTPLLTPAKKPHPDVEVYCTTQAGPRPGARPRQRADRATCQQAIERGERVALELPIVNTNRTVGTMLSHEIAKRWGDDLLPDDTIHIKFTGSAGQSFGAFLAKGVTLELEGDANDYVGKGLSGGRMVDLPAARLARSPPEENIIIGNVALYGATSGKAFFRGRAAERFAVRNSGAHAVIEGVGDHGCEYMTGGRVVVLGPTGRNFAAGMSGGIAYVWDAAGRFQMNCNLGIVELEPVVIPENVYELKNLVTLHEQYTGSTVARQILDNWDACLPQFVKVMPTDYKRVLHERMDHDEEIHAHVQGAEENGNGEVLQEKGSELVEKR